MRAGGKQTMARWPGAPRSTPGRFGLLVYRRKLVNRVIIIDPIFPVIRPLIPPPRLPIGVVVGVKLIRVIIVIVFSHKMIPSSNARSGLNASKGLGAVVEPHGVRFGTVFRPSHRQNQSARKGTREAKLGHFGWLPNAFCCNFGK
jgi:hypothetical protein